MNLVWLIYNKYLVSHKFYLSWHLKLALFFSIYLFLCGIFFHNGIPCGNMLFWDLFPMKLYSEIHQITPLQPNMLAALHKNVIIPIWPALLVGLTFTLNVTYCF